MCVCVCRELIFEMPSDSESCLPYRRPQCVTQIKVIGVIGMQHSRGEQNDFSKMLCSLQDYIGLSRLTVDSGRSV
jgi:hypothetical protein